MKLDDQLCFALYTASHAVMSAYRPVLDQMELTYPQYLVMIVLWQHGSGPVCDLAARLRVDPAAVTPLIKQLERSGYVYCARSSGEPPVETIVLTPTGVQLEEAATDAQRQVSCITGMTEASLTTLRADLHRLIDRITSGPGSHDDRRREQGSDDQV